MAKNKPDFEGALLEICENFRFPEFTHKAFRLEDLGGSGYEWTEVEEDGRMTLLYYMRLPHETDTQAFETAQKIIASRNSSDLHKYKKARYGKKISS